MEAIKTFGDYDACYSPDDGGWYLQQYGVGRDRVSTDIFSSPEEARLALDHHVTWEPWCVYGDTPSATNCYDRLLGA